MDPTTEFLPSSYSNDVMDAVNVDLKAFTEDFYWKVTGSHLQRVLETINAVRAAEGLPPVQTT